MKRWYKLFVVGLILLVGLVGSASAHAVALFGHLTVDEAGRLSVRLVDVYGGRVEGQEVVAYTTIPGGRPTKPEPLTEVAPGTYEGLVRPVEAVAYTLTIDFEIGGDVHRINQPVTVGVAVPEQLMVMEQIEPTNLPWSRMLFIAAGVVLLLGTVVALIKRPKAAESGVEDGPGAEAG